MYFIEHFCDMAHKDGRGEYLHMLQRDIIRVVDAVVPDDRSGAANVKVVRQVRTLLFLRPPSMLTLCSGAKQNKQKLLTAVCWARSCRLCSIKAS
jgi:hypothetical protein